MRRSHIVSEEMQANSTLEINTKIIKDNYRILKQLSSSEVSAAVKANAYGLGATQITKILISEGCKKFFVATVSEALELRKHFQDIEVFVLGGIVTGQEEYFFKNNLTAVINHLGQMEILNSYSASNNIQQKAILHIDSGMNRLGMPENEVLQLQLNPEFHSHLSFEYIMSHLASSEESDNKFNKIQLEKFNRLRQILPASKASIANSAGILLGSEYHLDLVRPGAAIYGLNLNEKMSIFRNPIRLFSRLLQVKEVKASDTIGYNQTFHFEKTSIMGTIPVGYADGIPRSLSNKGSCYVNNIRVPIIGRISMDLINIDLTHVPEQFRKIGQEIDLICCSQTPDQIAIDACTSGYEILTSLGQRYERKYKSIDLNDGNYGANDRF